ncbi:MAG: hypothetical protein Q7S96_01275 [bacterium]|nr:hypothetical protein [bacterium]
MLHVQHPIYSRAIAAMLSAMACIVLIAAPLRADATLCAKFTQADGTKMCAQGEAICSYNTPPLASCTLVTCETTPGCPGALEKLGTQCGASIQCGTGLVCEGAELPTAPGDEGTRGTCVITPALKTPPKQELLFEPIQARLSVPIPNLSFEQLRIQNDDGTNFVTIPWIAQYIAAIYRWAVPLGGVIAVVIIMVAGVIWMTSGTTGKLSQAQQMITNATIGLILLVGSYVVLQLINPDLVRLSAIRVDIVQREELPTHDEPDEVSGVEPGTVVSIATSTADNIFVKGGSTRVTQELVTPLKNAATALRGKGITLRITSALRPPEEQYAYIRKNCQVNPDGTGKKGTCDPATCLMTNGPKSCPHTTGHAVDAWGMRGGERCILSQDACAKSAENKRIGFPGVEASDPCRANECHAAVIAAMRGAGFCNWLGEAWHFEYPKPGMSQPCQ